MLKAIKEAFLKHSLYKYDLSDITDIYPFDQIPKPKYKKIASKDARFVYCASDQNDGAAGWFADAGTGYLRPGNCGFNKMSNEWAAENLTEPVELVGTVWKRHWENMFEKEDEDED
jgi:hypothetical protein